MGFDELLEGAVRISGVKRRFRVRSYIVYEPIFRRISNIDSLQLFTGIPTVARLPKYLKQTGLSTRIDHLGDNFLDRFGTDFWTWLEQHPNDSRAFNEMQAAAHHMLPNMNLGVTYPLSELLTDFPPDSNVPLLVDVGGGNGTDLELFRQALPQPYNETTGLILQDLPAVIDEAKKTKSFAANVEPMAHGFFTPQPIEGARAYFLNHVLHDWPDTRVH